MRGQQNLELCAATRFPCGDELQLRQGLLHAIMVDVPVRHHTHQMQRRVLGPDTLDMQRVAELDRAHAACGARCVAQRIAQGPCSWQAPATRRRDREFYTHKSERTRGVAC